MNVQEWLKQFETPQGLNFVTKDGDEYDNLIDYLQSGIFEFCGCGNAVSSLSFIRDGLSHIAWRSEYYAQKNSDYSVVRAKENEVFSNENIAYFFHYWADKQELTEHGGSVPGWLTKEGHSMLAVLNYAIEEENKNNI